MVTQTDDRADGSIQQKAEWFTNADCFLLLGAGQIIRLHFVLSLLRKGNSNIIRITSDQFSCILHEYTKEIKNLESNLCEILDNLKLY